MFSKSIIAIAALAGAVIGTPTPNPASLSLRQDSNCTNYYNENAGHACVVQPSDCSAFYTPQQGENCISVAEKFSNFSLSIFYYWNPSVGYACTELLADVPACINTPWYTYEGQIQPAPGTVEAVASTPAIDEPFPIPYNTTSDCDKYELAGQGVYVYNMVQDNGITYDQFYAWNPNTSNNVLIQNYWYCVGTSS